MRPVKWYKKPGVDWPLHTIVDGRPVYDRKKLVASTPKNVVRGVRKRRGFNEFLRS